MVYGVWCMVYVVCCMLYAVCCMLYLQLRYESIEVNLHGRVVLWVGARDEPIGDSGSARGCSFTAVGSEPEVLNHRVSRPSAW
jgi:hypothetical protein